MLSKINFQPIFNPGFCLVNKSVIPSPIERHGTNYKIEWAQILNQLRRKCIICWVINILVRGKSR